ncbi:glycosyltransferase [Aliarcobacter butzleri]|uniref:glycosyltransferase n=1 Tax=Aliarcobacter butzleri TaxID=28197 RepID=UPI0021B37894|nr:glycosyltransferase [Aliarcobacter butzleri]MCT7619674.1 glycosyltransferase [Aliarcobacter butzleri]
MNLILFNFESNKNSQALAFALDWINEIAKNVDKLYVISLRCGNFEVLNNVEVHCINQDKKSKLETIFSIWKVLIKIHNKDKNINGYFVHMAHYFVPIIYPLAKWYKQKIVLWYAHKSVPFSLRLAGILVDKIFSISSSSMLLKTDKFEAIGHGIDTKNRFILKEKFKNKIQNIVTVGRISKVKNIHIIVNSFILLNMKDIYLYIVGDIITEEDKNYLYHIKKIIPNNFKDNIIFTGIIPFEKLHNFYQNMDLAINLGDGGLDKAIIEPMAMGIPVITSNETAKNIFEHLNGKGIYLLKKKEDLKEVLNEIIEYNILFDKILLREEIVKKHSLNNLSKKILGEFL